MSSSKSLASVHFSGVRVAGNLQYFPASVRADGKEIQARCVIPVFINTARPTGANDGSTISHTVRLTAWGKLADVCAKSLPKGKELHATAEPRSYKGQTFYRDGNPVIDQDGQPLKVNKLSFNIQGISFGSDSNAFLAEEMKAGPNGEAPRRGIQWNIPGTPDHAAWMARIEAVKQLQYQVGMKTFGYAEVMAPRPAVAPVTNAQTNAAAVGTAFGGAGTAPAGYSVDTTGNVVMNDVAAATGAQPAGNIPF